MSSRTLQIHIDRLVVEGLPARGQQSFVRALESGLAGLAEGLDAKGIAARRIGRVDAGHALSDVTPERAAAQVTTALHGAITGKGNGRG